MPREDGYAENIRPTAGAPCSPLAFVRPCQNSGLHLRAASRGVEPCAKAPCSLSARATCLPCILLWPIKLCYLRSLLLRTGTKTKILQNPNLSPQHLPTREVGHLSQNSIDSSLVLHFTLCTLNLARTRQHTALRSPGFVAVNSAQ